MLEPISTNTILYCEPFHETVEFYRWLLDQAGAKLAEWLFEFSIGQMPAGLSVADASRCSVTAGDGRGLTVSWQVASLEEPIAELEARRIRYQRRSRMGGDCLLFRDPAGNRIEVWSSLQPESN